MSLAPCITPACLVLLFAGSAIYAVTPLATYRAVAQQSGVEYNIYNRSFNDASSTSALVGSWSGSAGGIEIDEWNNRWNSGTGASHQTSVGVSNNIADGSLSVGTPGEFGLPPYMTSVFGWSTASFSHEFILPGGSASTYALLAYSAIASSAGIGAEDEIINVGLSGSLILNKVGETTVEIFSQPFSLTSQNPNPVSSQWENQVYILIEPDHSYALSVSATFILDWGVPVDAVGEAALSAGLTIDFALGSGQSRPIPEPTSLGVLLVGVVPVLIRRRAGWSANRL